MLSKPVLLEEGSTIMHDKLQQLYAAKMPGRRHPLPLPGSVLLLDKP